MDLEKPRAQTSIDRVGTHLSMKTRSAYQTSRRYPKSLYNHHSNNNNYNNRATTALMRQQANERLKTKLELIGMMPPTTMLSSNPNESSYIYSTQTLFRSRTAGLDQGRRRDSLCGEGDRPPTIKPATAAFESNEAAVESDLGTIRPFSYLHRLPTPLYRDDEHDGQPIKIKVKRKEKNNATLYDDSSSDSESASPATFLDGVESVSTMQDIHKVAPLNENNNSDNDDNKTAAVASKPRLHASITSNSEMDDGDTDFIEDQTSFINDAVTTPPFSSSTHKSEPKNEQEQPSPSSLTSSSSSSSSSKTEEEEKKKAHIDRRDTPASAITVPLVTMEMEIEKEIQSVSSSVKDKAESPTGPGKLAPLPLEKKKPTIDNQSTDALIPSSSSASSSSPTALRQCDDAANAASAARAQTRLVKARLVERYPFAFAVIYSEVLIILSLLKIALQIVLLTNRAPFSYLACGIWSGCVGLVIFAVVVYTAFKRSFYSYKLSQVCILVGCGVFAACGIINSICLSVYQTCSSSSCSSSYNSSMLYVNLMLMVAEVATLSFSIVFLLDCFYEVERAFHSRTTSAATKTTSMSTSTTITTYK